MDNLNLARKWRSKNFDQIIGQEISVRILKNALFLNSFFPVYIFSGQRGCGKTSTARIFASAINCEKLKSFQENPKNISIPCIECSSCVAMKEGKHPDFIEIDAASHTGVDNVRQIIESSTLMPLMGKKKIYLIDEAHMLSKAAFNAFLKILEEPPVSVLFILATTDINKIIETVRSRSFQLFFTFVSNENLLQHLEFICKQEKIEYDIEGLEIIIKQSEGSVRDAINILEQVRFSVTKVTKQSVLDVLGFLSDEQLLKIFELLLNKNCEQLLKFLHNINFNKYSPDYIFNNILKFFQMAIRLKHGVDIKFGSNYFKEIVDEASINNILSQMSELCENELLFSKIVNKHIFLELLFIRISNNFDQNIQNKKLETISKDKQDKVVEEAKIEKKITYEVPENPNWFNFINELKTISDPLLNSVFEQANLINQTNKEVTISFSEKFVFFKELIEDTNNSWRSIFIKYFGPDANLKIEFMPDQSVQEKKPNIVNENNRPINLRKNIKSEIVFDVSDKEKWKKANELLSHFPGTIYEVQENS